MSSRKDPDPTPDPKSIYAAWRCDQALPDTAAFEELCARHPELVDELRTLHSKVVQLDSLLGPDPSAEARAAAGPDLFDALIARLRKRRPSESRYEERDEIARGGMGCIIELFDVDLRRSVAKKVVLGDRLAASGGSPSDSLQLARFCEEAQVTAQLSHPGVVPVHELGIDAEGRVFFTMDLVSGRTLGEVFELARAEREGWNLVRAVGVIERVCETLAYAHSRSVIHRDIKPGNVMVGEFGEVYVMDWGLAKLIGKTAEGAEASEDTDASDSTLSTDRRDASDRDSFVGLRTETGTAAGTPGYMAPEQARGDVNTLDARCDVYAVGALLYALLTGVKPFAQEVKAGDLWVLLQAMRRGEFTPISELCPDARPELVSIAERAMSLEPDARYADAEGLAADLRAWLEGRVVSAHEQGAWAELRKWVGRNRGLAAALILAFIAVLGGAAGMAVFERNGRLGVERQRVVSEVNSMPAMVTGLLLDTEKLWPALPAQAPELERWLEQYEVARTRSSQVAEAVAALEGKPSSLSEHKLDGRILERLKAVVDQDMQKLDERVAWMEERAQMAATVRQRSLESPEARRRWSAASEAIAASERYSKLVITPQLGLVPLREDPDSGLWEFWHVLSGAEPVLDAGTGRWDLREETGIVLVLIPGGTSRVGTPKVPKDDPLFDDFSHKDSERSDPPTHQVSLDPYFISKYELTQSQWVRARRENPSTWRADGGPLPAEMASWNDATETLARYDLQLPTEAQWEVAARGGRLTRFATGGDPASLIGHANIQPDLNYDSNLDVDEAGNPLSISSLPWTARPQPVGASLPNDFGLHDVHGNVYEWCRDIYAYSEAPRQGDGLREPAEETPSRVLRGGAYNSPWPNIRLGYRYVWDRQNKEPDTGCRPARPLDPAPNPAPR